MVVEIIKGLMEEMDIPQEYLAAELSKVTHKYYSQSMISKRLKKDNNISMDEFIAIWEVLNKVYKGKYGSRKRLHIDYFFKNL